MLAKVDGIDDVSRNGVSLVIGGRIISIHFYPYSWTYCYRVEIDGESVWVGYDDTLREIIRRIASGDRWVIAILKLISLFHHTTSRSHAERLFNSRSGGELNQIMKLRQEKDILKGLWISVMRWGNLPLASQALYVLKEYGDAFVNRKAYHRYLAKFKDAEAYLLAKVLSRKQ